MNNKHLVKHQRNMLEFSKKCPGWHGIIKDFLTQQTAKNLVKRGLIRLNRYGQIKYIIQKEN